jgi:hypothetical protein
MFRQYNRSTKGVHGMLDDGLDDPAHAMGKNMGGGKNGGNGDFLALSSIYILSVFRTVDFGRRISNEKRACLHKELKEVFCIGGHIAANVGYQRIIVDFVLRR